MKCLETRREGHFTMRRRLKPNGRRIKTMEIPWTLWLRVRPSVLKGVPGFERAEAARDRIAQVRALREQGHKTEYIAAVVGITGQRVRQITSQLHKEPRDDD